MIFRTILLWLRRTRGPKLEVHDVGRIMMRVWPTDLDILNHVNNGVYLSLMDLGRLDLLHRCGAWEKMTEHGIYPVVASETITFRKSLSLWQRYVIETRIVGYDPKAVFIEQRFVVNGEIYAQAFVRGRFLKRSGGTVPLDELAQALSVDTTELTLPVWLRDWSKHVGLPPTRAEAPSIWP
ncbi:MAG: thioesterase [Homoserinimonas sp.]|jgi:acyl-CoA thioesterase FadM|nr:thioesterase [Homoserinimonas sp.]